MGALTTLPVLCMGLFAPAAQRLARRHGAATGVQLAVLAVFAGVGVAALGRLRLGAVCRDVPGRLRHRRRRHAPAGSGQGALPAAPGRARHRALHARHDGRRRGVVRAVGAAGRPARVLAGLARLVEPARGRRGAGLGAGHGRARRGTAPPTRSWTRGTACPGGTAPPGWSRRSWRCSRGCSTRAWRGSRRRSRTAAGTRRPPATCCRCSAASRCVSGLLGPLLADRVRDRRVLLLSASVFGAAGLLGLAAGPRGRALGLDGRCWGWARARPSPSGMVLLIDYSRTPQGSGRLAAMVLFVSYSIAAWGPDGHGRGP